MLRGSGFIVAGAGAFTLLLALAPERIIRLFLAHLWRVFFFMHPAFQYRREDQAEGSGGQANGGKEPEDIAVDVDGFRGYRDRSATLSSALRRLLYSRPYRCRTDEFPNLLRSDFDQIRFRTDSEQIRFRKDYEKKPNKKDSQKNNKKKIKIKKKNLGVDKNKRV